MNLIKWKLMSKYKRLMYTISVCRKNKQSLYLGNGIILNFETDAILYESNRTTCGDPCFCGKCKDEDCPEYPKT